MQSAPALEPENDIIQPGKIPPELLQELLALPRPTCPELLLPPLLGEDAAVLRLEPGLLAIAADPVTFATPRPGYFAVNVNANDIAVTGARPCYFTLTLLLPPGSTAAVVREIMKDACAAAAALDIVLVGGHTEVTDAVDRAVVSVTMFGRLVRQTALRSGAGKVGDALIQVNPLGIEGTAILAAENRAALSAELGSARVGRAAAFAEDPGISVVAPALFAAEHLEVNAMHDPTEGGIATGLREIAAASGTGLLVQRASLIVMPETEQICECCGVDALGVISSGTLLMTVPPEHAADALRQLGQAGFTAAEIGCLTAVEQGCRLRGADSSENELPCFGTDELARARAG
jgi:hydrogenase maturation factor